VNKKQVQDTDKNAKIKQPPPMLPKANNNKQEEENEKIFWKEQIDNLREEGFDDEDQVLNLLRTYKMKDPDGLIDKKTTKARVKKILETNGSRNTAGTLDARNLTFAINNDDPGPDDNEGEQYGQDDTEVELQNMNPPNSAPTPAFESEKKKKQSLIQVQTTEEDFETYETYETAEIQPPDPQKMQKARASALDI